VPVESTGAGAPRVQVEQAAGLRGGKRDQVAPGFICYEGWRGVCSCRGEELSTAVRSPFGRSAVRVSAGGSRCRRLRGRRCGPGGMRGDGEEGVREHGQGGVPVPGVVPADLIVVQAGLVLGLSEAVLHSPARPGDSGKLGESDRPR